MIDQGGYEKIASDPARWLPDFAQRQKQAALEVYGLLIPYIRKGSITSIIDIGCGGGEILLDISARLSKEPGLSSMRDKPLRLIGLDSEKAQIDQAERHKAARTCGASLDIIFLRCPAHLEPLAELEHHLGEGLQWHDAMARTAILCLGHTIFHLPYLKSFLEYFAQHSEACPQLWIVDIYHSWDRVLAELALGREVKEPRSLTTDCEGNSVLNVLFTRPIAGSDERIERGLRHFSFPDGASSAESVVTNQVAWSSEKLVQAFAKARYIVTHEAPGRSGYGEVVRLGFALPQRTFPLPALFLDFKTIPKPPAALPTEESASMSPLKVIANWIAQSGLIKSEDDGGFDFVLVEVVPWYNDREGLRALNQEVLICAKQALSDEHRLRGMLGAYGEALLGLQSAGLGEFFHPSFSGSDFGSDWADVHFSLLSSSIATDNIRRPKDYAKYQSWLNILSSIEPGPKSPLEPNFESISLATHIAGWLQTIPIGDLVVTDDTGSPDSIERHRLRVRRDYPDKVADGGDLPSAETLRRDLELVHTLLHERLRAAFGLDRPGGSSRKTVLLGIPLRCSLDERPSPGWPLPPRYRGGVWIFAGVNKLFGPEENIQLGDLARLTVLLESSAIDAKAAEAFSRIVIDRTKQLNPSPAFQQAEKSWQDAILAVEEHGFFRSEDDLYFHTIPAWRALKEEERPQPQASQLIQTACKVMRAVTTHEFDLDFRESLILLKCLDHGPFLLPAAVVAKILGMDKIAVRHSVGDEDYSALRTSQYVSAGQLARAIYGFCLSKPNNGWTVLRALDRVDTPAPQYRLVFESEFKTKHDRDLAYDRLFMRPEIRMGRSGRRSGKPSGTEALSWIRTATRVRASGGDFIEGSELSTRDKMGTERRLKIEFTFPLE